MRLHPEVISWQLRPDSLTRSNSRRFSPRKFKWAYRKIDRLESKIPLIKGISFVSHMYTVEPLLDSKHHAKIYALCEKVGNDFASHR